MKIKISLFLMATLFVFLCTGCGGVKKTSGSSSDAQTADQVSQKEAKKVAEVVSDSSVPIEKATLSAADASEKVKSLSMKTLGLEGKKDDYKFMVGTKGKVLEKYDCLEVNASKEIKKNDDGTINMQTVAQYFVTYDGEKIFKRDLNTGEYIELKP